MRDAGLELAIKAAGGVGSLARELGIAQPSVSAWSRIPAERVLAVEALTQVTRFKLRPDLYGPAEDQVKPHSEIDEIDQLRAA
jgi:DNA-binding transcriptional regulator YdaS (Cro superfamily)